MARLLEFIIVIFLFAVIGSIIPFIRKWNSGILHLFVAFGAGVFLGAVFFHLLPDVKASKDAFVYVLTGFVFVLLFEKLTPMAEDTGQKDQNKHNAIGMAAFFGLIVHSLTAGFALGVAALSNESLGFILFFAIIAHKAVGAFSLATILRLSSFSTWKSVKLLFTFSLMTPLGAVIAYIFMSNLSTSSMPIPTALAAGTFLYVATMDLLPEAFHIKDKLIGAILSMFLGLAVMLVISFVV